MKNYMPVRVYTGPGVLAKQKMFFEGLGKRCLIVTSLHSGKASGAIDDLEEIFKEYGIDYKIYDRIKKNPTVVSCIEAGLCACDFKASFLVGVGGGSVLDAAKTAAVVARNPDLDEEGIYRQDWQNKPLPLILVGTTAGTGSEVTYVSVMTNAQGMKKSIHNDDLYALYAFGDPAYTKSMPTKVRNSTAVDALAHLVESYFSNSADDLSRGYSLQGIRLLYPMLRKMAAGEELNDEERQTVYDASILGGLAINSTGTVFCHTLGYYFTEHYHLPHGFACAIFMNDLLDYEAVHHPEYADPFYATLQIKKEELQETVKKLLPVLDFRMSEKEIEALLPRYDGNKSVRNTYGKMGIEDIREVLNKLK
ncbi:MAG: iron-containing alcohol dehydrogenase [Erysipelotrichaceae bacterium]|nr:iron-containing alcohol dehydrogenase [Erysipelotrichaceae bacterium]